MAVNKILVITKNNPYSQPNATSNRLIGLAEGIKKIGADVTLLVVGGVFTKGENKTNDVNGIKIRYALTYPNYNIWFRRLNQFVLRKLINWLVIKHLRKFFVSDYDYVWITETESVYRAVVKYKSISNSRVFMELNEFHDIYKGQKLNKAQLKVAVDTEKAFLDCVKLIDCFAIMTETLMQHYKQLAKPEARFIHLPMTVDCSRFEKLKLDYIRPRKYIGYVGSFNNAKDGVDILIKAFARIADKYQDVDLVMAGYYYNDQKGQKIIIEANKLQKRVFYLDPLSREEIPSFLCNATVLALARPDSHQAQGGFPTKLGEYLATGNPVCATTVGEIPNYLKDNVNAFLARPGDVDSFADALDRVLSNPTTASNVGKAGKDTAFNTFSTEVQSLRLYNFLFT